MPGLYFPAIMSRKTVMCCATQHGVFDSWFHPYIGCPCSCACAYAFACACTFSMVLQKYPRQSICTCIHVSVCNACTHPTHVIQALSQYQCVCNAAVSATTCTVVLSISRLVLTHVIMLTHPRRHHTHLCSQLSRNANFFGVDPPKQATEACCCIYQLLILSVQTEIAVSFHQLD